MSERDGEKLVKISSTYGLCLCFDLERLVATAIERLLPLGQEGHLEILLCLIKCQRVFEIHVELSHTHLRYFEGRCQA
jgi:hypothetical protein